METMTNSEVSAFRNCPAYWGFRYEEKLELDREEATAASWGTLGHAGMEAAWRSVWAARGAGYAPAFSEVLVVAKAAALAKARDIISKMGENQPEEDAEKVLQQAEELGDVLPITLRRNWKAMLTHELVAAEWTFSYPVATGVQYQGQVDLITKDPATGRVVVWDHKFTVSVDAFEGRLQLDTQCVGYIWAVQQLLPNENVGQFVWNITRRKKPAEPRVLKISKKKAKELNRQDLLDLEESTEEPQGYVSAAACDTIPEVYEMALLEQEMTRMLGRTDEQVGRLEAIVEADHKWFRQEELWIGPSHVERWVAELLIEHARMETARGNSEHRTRNPGHCSSPQSYKCDYRDICLSDAPETRALYRVRKNRHAELADQKKVNQ